MPIVGPHLQQDKLVKDFQKFGQKMRGNNRAWHDEFDVPHFRLLGTHERRVKN